MTTPQRPAEGRAVAFSGARTAGAVPQYQGSKAFHTAPQAAQRLAVLAWMVIMVLAVSIVLPCIARLPQHGARRLCVCRSAALQGQAPMRLATALQQRAFDLV